MSTLLEISERLQRGKAKDVMALVQTALDEGISAKEILEGSLLVGMGIIGEKFKNNEVFVPEVLVAARAMNKGLEILKPFMADAGIEEKGTIVIGTVKGDLHDIGKNLVKIMMEGKGIKVVDLGVDVTAETFVEQAIENGAKIICCSALLTTTMNEMQAVVETLEANPAKGDIKIMIGGAPITQVFCDKIGAHCFTADAASAADEAINMLIGA